MAIETLDSLPEREARLGGQLTSGTREPVSREFGSPTIEDITVCAEANYRYVCIMQPILFSYDCRAQ